MAFALLGLLILSLVGGISGSPWCVCKSGVPDSALQRAIDYACGYGADCNPTLANGPCFNPNTVKAHCDYAVNSYFQRKGQAQGSCDFAGAATITTTDPSINGCSYPSSAGGQVVNNPSPPATPTTGSPPFTNVPSTNTPPNTPFTNSPPSIFNPTPPNGGIVGGGGFNPGLGPSGFDPNTGFLARASMSISAIVLLACTMLVRA